MMNIYIIRQDSEIQPFYISVRYSYPYTGVGSPLYFQEVETPRFPDSLHMKLVSPTYWPPLPRKRYPWYSLVTEMSMERNGRTKSMKNSNDSIGNRTRDLPACSAVPQPISSPRASTILYNIPEFACRDSGFPESLKTNTGTAPPLHQERFVSKPVQYIQCYALHRIHYVMKIFPPSPPPLKD
jgi:hypothetical protein